MSKVKPSPDDKEIIQLYFDRDESAIDKTAQKYKGYLFSVAFNIIGNRQDCEEILNEAYLSAWNSIPPTRPQSLKLFLAVITRRIAINRYHHTRRQRRIPSELTVALDELEAFISDSDSAESDFDAAHLGQIINSFVGELSSRQRFIFMSRYYASESIGSIASLLGVSRSTVNKELALIRATLKENLEREGYSV